MAAGVARRALVTHLPSLRDSIVICHFLGLASQAIACRCFAATTNEGKATEPVALATATLRCTLYECSGGERAGEHD